MKNTHTLLDLTENDYQEDIIQRYMRWCENIAAKHHISLQSVMANSAIANYYFFQFRELEHEFAMSAELIYKKVGHTIIRNMYVEIMTQLYLSHPSALIEEAKKLRIENPPIWN
jgi:hypothetical protein